MVSFPASELLAGLFESPDLYVSEIDFRTDELTVRQMSRQSYTASSFLDKRAATADGTERYVPLHRLYEAFRDTAPPRRPLRLIFHTALCGSTLLCRCLDRPGVCLPYKEPYLLHQLSFLRRFSPRTTARLQPFSLLELCCALLSRTYEEAEAPVVKPTDSCINLACDLLQHHDQSSALLLYQDLDRFLLAMLKNEGRRQYCREMVARARSDLDALGLLRDVPIDRLTDAQAAAFVWLGVIYAYLDLLADETLAVRSLNARDFYQCPHSTLCALADFFALAMGAEEVEAVLQGGIMRRDAKDPAQAYDRRTYRVRAAQFEAAVAAEIEEGIAWAAEVTRAFPVPRALPRPLFNPVFG